MNPIKIADREYTAAPQRSVVRVPGRRRRKYAKWNLSSLSSRRDLNRRIFNCYVQFQSVIPELHMVITGDPQPFIRSGVRKLMCDVRKPGASRLEPIDYGERLLYSLMHRVRCIAQCVDNEFIQILQQ